MHLARSILGGFLGWHRDAACREHPEINFFPERGEPVDPAKAVCGRCLVRAECLNDALAQPKPVGGIWGGTSERERRQLRRTRTAA